MADAAPPGCPVRRAVIADAVHKIAELSAKRAFEADAIVAVSTAHGDNEFAERVRRDHDASRLLTATADAVVAKLQTTYTTTTMLDTLSESDDPPLWVSESNTVTLAGKSFSTSNGSLLAHVWVLRNPGYGVVDAFCRGLGATQGDLTDPDDFLVFFDSAVSGPFLDAQIEAARRSFNAAQAFTAADDGQHLGLNVFPQLNQTKVVE